MAIRRGALMATIRDGNKGGKQGSGLLYIYIYINKLSVENVFYSKKMSFITVIKFCNLQCSKFFSIKFVSLFCLSTLSYITNKLCLCIYSATQSSK